MLKSFPDLCRGAIAGVEILIKSSLIKLGSHAVWPRPNWAWDVGALGAPTLLEPKLCDDQGLKVIKFHVYIATK